MITESTIELATLELLTGLLWSVAEGAAFSPENAPEERAGYGDVVLAAKFRAALERINPKLRPEALDEAVRKVLHPAHATSSVVENNRTFHRMLVNGVDVEYRRADGTVAGEKAWLIDWEHPDEGGKNELLAVNQLVIIEDGHKRRPDIILYVNGLPLVVLELKNAADEEATVKNAYQQLQTYRKELPTLFAYNAFTVVSDGLEARAGTLTSDWERFSPWRPPHGVKSQGELVDLLEGMFTPARLLDLIKSFIVFEDDGEKVVKKIAAYHQVAAVNKAVEQTVRAAGDGGDRKAGVVWHTQGSGKSLSMVFFAGKLVQAEALANPTLVVLTDRNDLDEQLFGTFCACSDLFRQTPVQAESRDHLQALLKTGSGGVIFTTIQKFLPENTGDRLSALTERSNVVVIADEAHRSQAGLSAKGVKKDANGTQGMVLAVGLAQHVRDALPQATFIGFTGTPIKSGDKSTPRIFGKYIDIYDIKQAVIDKATVPIYYEARLARLQLKEEERPHLDPEFEEITEGEEETAREKLKTKWAAVEKLVGAPPRLREVARDLVEHFEKRYEAMPGKGMIVCMSRRICVALYDEIVKLRPQWHSADDAKGGLKVVMTGSADDPEAYHPHVRNKAGNTAMAKRFKDPKDELKLVIVRDMWLTGFDAPCIHTMYVDKPMGGHNLMQAIARVNRVFKDKPGGLVVDYLGLADQLKSAMKDYTDAGGDGLAVEEEAQAVAQLQKQYEQCCGILHGFDWRDTWLKGTPAQRLALIPASQDFILGLHEGRKRFLDCTTALGKAFALAAGSDEAMELREEVAFFQVIRTALTKTTVEGQRHAEALDSAINQLIAGAIHSTGILNVFDAAGMKNPNIEILSDEFLAEVKAMPHRNLALELLRKLINGEIKARGKRNVVQARKFSEMLENAIRSYQNRAIQAAQVIDELIAMAKEMRRADARGEQMGLDATEVAFYDALADNASAVEALGDDNLKVIAVELVRMVKANTTIDWTEKESVKANLRRLVKRILRKYGYPPDLEEKATQTVLEQAKVLCAEVAA